MVQEELRFRTLRKKFFGKPNKIEDEIELREEIKKKIDNIEALKEEVKEWEFKSVKILHDLNSIIYTSYKQSSQKTCG